MKKFAVFSGFLGTGKTTSMIALTNYCTDHHFKAAMISNDLGEGVTLADHRYAVFSGCNAIEMTDECICFTNEELAGHLNDFYEDGCELVISDIPGFGVGALEHVYHGLTEKFPGQFELAPFTVLTEPETVRLLRSHPESDRAIISRCQLMEADLIVLNKCDLLDQQDCSENTAWLRGNFPQAKVIAISALRGDGLEEFMQEMKDGRASLSHPDIDYDGDPLQDAMGRISEYYIQYHAVVCCNTFDGTDYLSDIAGEVRDEVTRAGYDIPHLKLLAWGPDGDFGKADLVGTDRRVEINRSFLRPCTELAVILNASAFCPEQELDELITSAVKAVSGKYQLELMIFKEQCFGMGE